MFELPLSMKVIQQQEWLNDKSYLQVTYRPDDDKIEVRLFTVDPRKAQYYKLKYWNRGLWIPFQSADTVRQMATHDVLGSRYGKVILKLLDRINETSSDRRAFA